MLEHDKKRENLERLYDEYYDKVYVYIARRVNNRHDAEDLTADVFLKAFANPYNPLLAKFSTYIYTIASNVLKNHYRTVANRFAVTDGEQNGDLPDETDLLKDLITREEYAELKSALAVLPERQYEAVYRRYYLDESFKEIGAAMRVSEGGARQLHFEALKNLRKILKTP